MNRANWKEAPKDAETFEVLKGYRYGDFCKGDYWFNNESGKWVKKKKPELWNLLERRPEVLPGSTATQLIDAPIDSIFVWNSSHFEYVRDLAEKLNRTDLEFRSLREVFGTDHGWRGIEKEITIDHYCYEIMTVREHDNLIDYQKYLRQKAREQDV